MALKITSIFSGVYRFVFCFTLPWQTVSVLRVLERDTIHAFPSKHAHSFTCRLSASSSLVTTPSELQSTLSNKMLASASPSSGAPSRTVFLAVCSVFTPDDIPACVWEDWLLYQFQLEWEGWAHEEEKACTNMCGSQRLLNDRLPITLCLWFQQFHRAMLIHGLSGRTPRFCPKCLKLKPGQLVLEPAPLFFCFIKAEKGRRSEG